MTLWEIDNAIVHALSLADDESGEIPDSALALLDQLEMERVAKITNVLAVIRNSQAQADAIDIEIARLQAMRSSPARTVERLKDYLFGSMMVHGETKIDCGAIGKPRIQKNSQPSIGFSGEVGKLDERWKRVTVDLDKRALLEAYKAGEPLPEGVSVETGYHLRLG
jgi:Siphovirus Gp157.